jgi:hypothetical protein
VKITIKHILNKNLKPITDPKNPSIKLYPVYTQLILNRKNYQFKGLNKKYYTDLQYISNEDSRLMTYEIELLRSIIGFEIKLKGEKFDVAGLGDRYEKYRRSIVSEAERLLIGKIEAILRKIKSKFQDILDYSYTTGKYGLLLETVNTLLPDMKEEKHFRECELADLFWKEYAKTFPEKKKFHLVLPTVFDWFNGNHKQVMVKILVSKFNEILDFDMLLAYVENFDFMMKKQLGLI